MSTSALDLCMFQGLNVNLTGSSMLNKATVKYHTHTTSPARAYYDKLSTTSSCLSPSKCGAFQHNCRVYKTKLALPSSSTCSMPSFSSSSGAW